MKKMSLGAPCYLFVKESMAFWGDMKTHGECEKRHDNSRSALFIHVASNALQCLIQILDEIVHILDPHRHPHEIRGYARCDLLLSG